MGMGEADTGNASIVTDAVMVDLLLFRLDTNLFALRLGQVVRVAAMVAIAPLPEAPPVVAGIIDVGGAMLPVLDVRPRLGVVPHPPRLTDALVLVRTSNRDVCIWVDQVLGTHTQPADRLVPTEQVVPGPSMFDAVTTLPDGPIFIHDIDRFLSLAEEQNLEAALRMGSPA